MSDWLVEGLIPRHGIHLFGGAPTASKSALMADLVRACQVTGDFFGHKAYKQERLGVVLLDRPTIENPSWQSVQGLYHAHYNAIEDPSYAEWVENTLPTVRAELRGIYRFRYALSKLPWVEDFVVLIDVFSGSCTGDLLNFNHVKTSMDSINTHCYQKKITVLAVVYGVKVMEDRRARYSRLIDRIIGPASLRGAASTMMYLTTVQESKSKHYQQFEISPRTGKAVELALVRGEAGFTLYRESHDPELDESMPEPLAPVPPACTRVLTYISAIEARGEDIYKAYQNGEGETARSYSRFRDYLSELARRGLVENSGRGMYKKSH